MGKDSLALLLEYLDASSQPTFVLCLDHTASKPKEQIRNSVLTHANPALQRLTHLYAEVERQIQTSPDTLRFETDSNNPDKESSHNHPCSFCGIKWDARILSCRWLVAVSTEQHHGRQELESTKPSQSSASPDSSRSTQVPSSNGQSSAKIALPPDKDTVSPRPPLGTVNPRGYLGDLEYLKWMRQHDWKASSIGPIEQWPAELRHVCEFALATSDPINILWGDEYTFLYNEAYSLVVGDKHPGAMGRPFKEYFPQWPEYYKIFDRIRETGQSVQQDTMRRMLIRKGFLEECFFDILLAPILAADGSVAGFTTRIQEVTKRVIFERRMRILTDINEAMATMYNLHDLCRAAAGVLDKSKNDVHFAAIYSTSFRDHTVDLVLEATAGIDEGYNSTTVEGDSDVPHFGLNQALLEACTTREAKTLSTSDNSLTPEILGQFEQHGIPPCREILIHPLKCFVEDNIVAVLIVGTTPLGKFDEDCRSFLQLMTRQIENGITVVGGIAREKELHRAQIASELDRRFWRFAENAPVGMYIYSADDVLTFWNTAFENIIGKSGEELTPQLAWMDAVHPDNVAEITAIWERYRTRQCDEAVSFEIQFKKPWTSQGDGVNLDRTWALGVLQPEYSEDGELQGTLGCITDISSVKWAEKMQSARLSEAIEQKRQQENFLDVTSHEMRNPLNAIFQCAHELTENIKFKLRNSEATTAQIGTLNESLDLATTISYCANHQKRIVDDVLTLSKLDARLLQIYPESTNPIKLYREILALFGPETRASGINTNFMVGEGYNCLDLKRVMMDPSRVTQIVINLLSNAIKFTKKGKKRDLEMNLNAHTEEPANRPMGTRYVPSGVQYNDPTDRPEWGQGDTIYLSFAVKDSGLGMTPEEASNLFQKFSQASPRTHAQFGGSGLGLYISRNLAELHGGRIGLSSQAGFGSTFEFYVKVRRSEAIDLPTRTVDKPVSSIEMSHMNITSPAMQQAHPESPQKKARLKPQTQTAATALSSGANVLIVEDNLINQRLLKKLITKHGYDTTTANNGEEALAFMASSTWNPVHIQDNSDVVPTIDIVLCDIEMPIMDGKTCVRRVRQLQQEALLTENIPMVAITGNARAEQVEEMRQCGFDDVVTKPYKINQLLRIIERYIGPRDESPTEETS